MLKNKTCTDDFFTKWALTSKKTLKLIFQKFFYISNFLHFHITNYLIHRILNNIYSNLKICKKSISNRANAQFPGHKYSPDFFIQKSNSKNKVIYALKISQLKIIGMNIQRQKFQKISINRFNYSAKNFNFLLKRHNFFR